jgi:hypothetical protein
MSDRDGAPAPPPLSDAQRPRDEQGHALVADGRAGRGDGHRAGAGVRAVLRRSRVGDRRAAIRLAVLAERGRRGACWPLVVGIATVRLWLRLRHGKFGSRLLVKLAGIFALVGVLPGLVIYTVSYQFASRSIETWFDVRLAQALDAGLALGKGTLDSLRDEAARKAELAAERLTEPGAAAVTPRWRWSACASSSVSTTCRWWRATARCSSRWAARPSAWRRSDPPAACCARHVPAGRATQIDGLDDEQAAANGAPVRIRALVRLRARQHRASARRPSAS